MYSKQTDLTTSSGTGNSVKGFNRKIWELKSGLTVINENSEQKWGESLQNAKRVSKNQYGATF